MTTDRNAPDYNYGAEDWRQPKLLPGDVELYAEPGRILEGGPFGGTDCRSHSFKLVKAEFGGYYLLVQHGAGEERLSLGHSKRILDALEPLNSDARYWLLHTFLDVAHKSEQAARQETAREYAKAFIDGRLKKRRKNNCISVHIEQAPLVQLQDA